MSLSVNEFTYAGNDVFSLNFALGFASESDVTAYKPGDPNVSIAFDFVTKSSVRLDTGHGLQNGDTIVFRRTVSKTTLPVDLTVPGNATRENLETVALHFVYIAHELLDQRTVDVHPWEEIGSGEAITSLLSLDYLAYYTDERDA